MTVAVQDIFVASTSCDSFIYSGGICHGARSNEHFQCQHATTIGHIRQHRFRPAGTTIEVWAQVIVEVCTNIDCRSSHVRMIFHVRHVSDTWRTVLTEDIDLPDPAGPALQLSGMMLSSEGTGGRSLVRMPSHNIVELCDLPDG